jgi:hypothetical protein
MRDDNFKKGGSSIGIGTIIFIVLLILKLTGAVPGLTWFWVFFPLWIGPAVIVCLLGILILLDIFFNN